MKMLISFIYFFISKTIVFISAYLDLSNILHVESFIYFDIWNTVPTISSPCLLNLTYMLILTLFQLIDFFLLIMSANVLLIHLQFNLRYVKKDTTELLFITVKWKQHITNNGFNSYKTEILI